VTATCQRPESGRFATCLTRLAGGWILPQDLCPQCTTAFMSALDGIAGPMEWHGNYIGRAHPSSG
jgi:hypothetical protein